MFVNLKVAHVWRVLVILFVGGMFLIGVSGKVVTLPSEQYRREAREIRVTRAWRYGYASGHHGAFLVRTRNAPDFAPVEACTSDSELDRIMLGELRAYPWKSLLEGVFYALVLAYTFTLVPWMRRALFRRQIRWHVAAQVEGAFWIIGWSVCVAPLVFLGYGSSLFTTWSGPGALSFSGPYLGNMTGLSGETIAYRPLLETVGSLPVLVVRPGWFGSFMDRMGLPLYLWLVGSVFWGAVGVAAELLRRIPAEGQRAAGS
jgi:hypothetical protein